MNITRLKIVKRLFIKIYMLCRYKKKIKFVDTLMLLKKSANIQNDDTVNFTTLKVH